MTAILLVAEESFAKAPRPRALAERLSHRPLRTNGVAGRDGGNCSTRQYPEELARRARVRSHLLVRLP